MNDANEYYLRKHENEMVASDICRKEREIKLSGIVMYLKYNSDSVIEALREATYGMHELELSQLHIAFVNRNMEELGKLVYDLIEDELKLEAERIVD